MNRSGANKSGASQAQPALSRMRQLIKAADPDVVEEWKWMGTPAWSHEGVICTGESYKKVVKLTFANGASLEDPAPCPKFPCPKIPIDTLREWSRNSYR